MGHAPWSVKGIDPKARAKAREHAQRDGITLGSYLNRLLLEDSGTNSDDNNNSRPQSPLKPILRGEAGAERINEVAETLEEISRRMHAGENRSTQSLAGVDQSMLTLLNRLEASERQQAGLASRFDGALNDMRATHASLEERLDSSTRKDNSGRMLEAMRALEGALSKLAKQVHETQDQVANDQKSLRSDVQRDVTNLSKEVDSVSRRADDSARKFDDTASRVDRIERNSEDRFRDVLSRTENALDVARAQSRKSEERFNSLQDRLDNSDRNIASASKASQKAVNDLQDNLKSFAAHTDNKLDDALATSDAALSIAREANEAIPAQIAKSNKELSDKLFGNITDVAGRLETTQKNVTSIFAKVSDVDTRVNKFEGKNKSADDALANLQSAMDRINERFSESEENKTNAINNLEKSFSSLDERLDEIQEKVGDSTDIRSEFDEKLATIADNFSKTLEETRVASVEQLEKVGAANQSGAVETLQQQMEAVQSDIAASEERQLQAVELITGQFERLSDALDDRIRSVEGRTASETSIAELRSELERTTEEINSRLGNIEKDGPSKLSPLIEQVSKMAAHMEERLDETNSKIDNNERRSAEAIEQVGEHVARATERLQAKNEESFETIYEKIEEVSNSNQSHISSTMDDIERRLKEAQEQAERIVSPVQNTVSSLAQRVEELSENSNLGPIEAVDFSTDIAPPPLPDEAEPQTDLDIEALTNSISDSDTEEFDGISAVEDDDLNDRDEITNSNLDIPPMPKSETVTNIDTINDADIANIAHNARREFAAELKEQRAQLEAEAEMFRQNDEAVSQFGQRDSDDLFDEDDETDAFTSSLELEYEVEMPADETAPHLRSDEGIDDDPYARASKNSSEFLQSARAAAKERGSSNRAVLSGSEERKSSKLPIVAAGVLAAAVVGGAGMMAMRGKQANADDSFTTTPPRFTPDAGQKASLSEDDDTLFDAEEEALEASAAFEREKEMAFTDNEVDEELLFPEDAKILTSENIQAAEATSGALNSKSAQSAPAKVSPLDAFASSRTKAETASAPAAAPTTLEAAAESGSDIALHELAIKQLASGEKRLAAETMRRAADNGLAAAQYRMGKLYERGEGVPRSIKESRKWTTRAAENGNVKAMHDLAVFYAEGEGGEQSFLAGVEWFTKAADYGLIDSQYNLGVLYEQGLGVSQDPAKAAYWFKIAGLNGDADGTRRARSILESLPASEARSVSSKADSFTPRTVNPAANGKFGAQPWNAPVKAQVKETQQLLSRISGANLSADGVMGPQTRNAIREFEASNGLIPTGDVSDALLRLLRSKASVPA